MITDEKMAYLIGFIQSDGTMEESTRNRGKIKIELQTSDSNILEKMKTFLLTINVYSSLSSRTRNTNFKKGYSSTTLTIYNLEFRNFMKKYIPVGKKAFNVEPPLDLDDCCVKHYIRGLIDGDGSIGFLKDGRPFISLFSVNKKIIDFCEEYFFKLTKFHRNLTPNTRDNGYNLMYSNEEAQTIIRDLYENSEIYLDRKYNNAMEALKWVRPPGRRKRTGAKKWDEEQDNYILTHSVQESMEVLKRTEKSIKTRLFRLTH